MVSGGVNARDAAGKRTIAVVLDRWHQRQQQHGNAINEEFGANKVKTCVVRLIYGICILSVCAAASRTWGNGARNPRKKITSRKKVGNQAYTKYERVLIFFRLALCVDKLEENCEKDFSSEKKNREREKLSQFGVGGVWEFYCGQDKLTRDDKFGPAG